MLDAIEPRNGARSWLRLLALSLLALALAGPAAAQDENWGYLLSHDLMSPYCPGRTLAQCTSPQAAELRQWILLQEAAGASREEVEAQLYEKYGDIILSAPRADDAWGISAYALPAVFFVIGGPVVYLVLRRLVGERSLPAPAAEDPSPPAPSKSDSELEQQIEAEISRSDRRVA